jgi:hypothetical protein
LNASVWLLFSFVGVAYVGHFCFCLLPWLFTNLLNCVVLCACAMQWLYLVSSNHPEVLEVPLLGQFNALDDVLIFAHWSKLQLLVYFAVSHVSKTHCSGMHFFQYLVIPFNKIYNIWYVYSKL